LAIGIAGTAGLGSVDPDAYKVAVMRLGGFRLLAAHFSVDAVRCGSNQPKRTSCKEKLTGCPLGGRYNRIAVFVAIGDMVRNPKTHRRCSDD